MYVLGMSKIEEMVSKGSVACPDNASLRAVGVSDHHMINAKKVVGKNIAGIIAKDFTPCPGLHCQSCDYME